MSTVITTTEFQKNMAKYANDINSFPLTVMKEGEAKMIVLPYFSNNDESVLEYLEEYEIQKNKNMLEKQCKESQESQLSSLRV